MEEEWSVRVALYNYNCVLSFVFLQVRLLHPSELKYEYDNIHILLIYFCNNICSWIRNKFIISLTLPHGLKAMVKVPQGP